MEEGRDVAKFQPLAKAGECADSDEELEGNGGQFTRKMAIGQVTIRLPLDPSPLNLIALAYGFIPWLLPASFAAHWFIRRHFMALFGLLASVFVSLLNEFCLKALINDPRPRQSANKRLDGSMKPGMPSGHVLNSATLMTWSLLEVCLNGPGMDSKHEALTMGWLVFILILMVPVPWARWYNLDHTAAQCLCSIVLGIIFGFTAYLVRVHYFAHQWAPWAPWKV
uniref:Phosphatidic acid phosphatase type 2/haloperoxidase domain-containing protein n=1 Tax=Noctiluca scintillans TaxID=2966 RepID=A0A7S1AJ56_NOCSC